MYAIDEQRVLRRYRTRTVPAGEIRVMRHARAAGYPVPEVISSEGPDLVLERVVGPTMRQALERAPHELEWHARTFAALHERLFQIAPPDGIRSISDGDALLHLDFHPENVLMAARGPVVIDWANAARGHWADDVALTVVIIAGVLLPDPMPTLARHFVEVYLAAFDRAAVRAHLPAAIERRVRDPNLSDDERAAARDVTV